MSASTYEYKTVALPQTVQGKRRRGVSEADFVAETLGELIHLEAVDGWEYMRADTLAAGARAGLFSKEPRVTYYTVLVFRRMQEGVWPAEGTASPAQTPLPPFEESVTPIPAPVQPKPPVVSARPPVERAPAAAPELAPAPAPRPAPVVAPRPHPQAQAQQPRPEPQPVAPPPPTISDPTSPLAQGMVLTTGGQFSASTTSGITPRPAPKTTAPLPPLGSAQD